MSSLTEEQVLKIKFEYDLASLQKQVDELLEMASATGSNKDWAIAALAQKQERDLLEEQTGYTKDSDSGYQASYDEIDDLVSSRRGKNEDELAEINTKITALESLQSAFQLFRLDGGDMDWRQYLQTEQAAEAMQEIMDSTLLTQEELNKLTDPVIEPLESNQSSQESDLEFNIKTNDEAREIVENFYSEILKIPEETVSELIAEDKASEEVLEYLSELANIPIETLTKINSEDGATGVLATVLSAITGIPADRVTAMLATDDASYIAQRVSTVVSTSYQT